jgi:hypothetical protein
MDENDQMGETCNTHVTNKIRTAYISDGRAQGKKPFRMAQV